MYCYQHGLGILQSVQYLGYWMENQLIVITFTVVEKNVLSPLKHSDWFWGQPSFLLNGLPPVIKLPQYEVKHTSNYCWDKECMELYLHSQTYLQGRVFSSAQQQLYFYYDDEQQQNHMQFGIHSLFKKFFFITHRSTSVGLEFIYYSSRNLWHK
jgi:hypothetical protein